MRKQLLAAALGAAMLVPAMGYTAEEESPHTLSANVGLWSQYIFRGVTQTDEDPALQGGLDYSHKSGFYLGMWGSNISWLHDAGLYKNSSLEVDFYGGFRNAIGDTDFSYDVGLLQYWYPGNKASSSVNSADTTEVYAGVGWKWLSAKFSYSLTDTFGFDNSDGSYYFDLGASVPLGESGVTLGAHYGHQEFEGRSGGVSNDDFSYNDWKLSAAYDLGMVSKVMSGATIGVMYTETDAKDSLYTNANGTDTADGKITVWISKSF